MDALRIVAEPSRREILRLVWREELPASQIAARFDTTFGAVSQHLAVLRRANMVTVRKDGNRRLYRANHQTLAPFASMLKAMWADQLDRLAELAEGEDVS
jgi:DNA-binding transcriptional ArsR family regulator